MKALFVTTAIIAAFAGTAHAGSTPPKELPDIPKDFRGVWCGGGEEIAGTYVPASTRAARVACDENGDLVRLNMDAKGYILSAGGTRQTLCILMHMDAVYGLTFLCTKGEAAVSWRMHRDGGRLVIEDVQAIGETK